MQWPCQNWSIAVTNCNKKTCMLDTGNRLRGVSPLRGEDFRRLLVFATTNRCLDVRISTVS